MSTALVSLVPSLFLDEAEITYSSIEGFGNRHIQAGGQNYSSEIPLKTSDGSNLHADYDLSWLLSKDPPAHTESNLVRVVDLFAGCGGFTLGVHEAARAFERSCTSVGAIDFDRGQAATFKRNFPKADVRSCDINLVFPGEVGDFVSADVRSDLDLWQEPDFVIGGPPCQGHSHLNNATRGHDERNLLALKMARAAELLTPKFVIVENVPGVARDEHRAWEQMEALLRGLDKPYDAVTMTLRAEEFGVAQTRRRSFMLAWRRDLNPLITPALVTALVDMQRVEPRPIEWALQGLPKASYENPLFDRPPTLASQTVKRIEHLEQTGTGNLPDDLRPDCHRLKEHSYHSVYGRMHAGKPASTMTTGFSVMGRGRFVHPHEPRMLTPHEAARIQFFPDFFDFGAESTRTEYCRAIGNAVPPKMGFVVSLALLLAEASTNSG
jgi:DNA (cytosine-5)-methyltransferase 1